LVKEADRYRIVASTDIVDRDDEIMLPSSFKNLKNYLATNPVILWAHNYSVPPIAKATDGKITDDQLSLDIEFAETEFGKEVKYLYDNGFMSSFSVGFIPKAWDRDPDGRLVFTEVELLEVSAVPVPSNAQANIMRTAKSAGVDLTEVNKLFLIDRDNQTPQPKGDPVEDVKSQVEINKSIYGGLA
jgi:HK97 family phage prohead protease